MKNKGFTLIELLGVIAVLAIVVVIITPKIFSQFKTAEQASDREQINALIESSKIYMNQKTELLPEGNNEYVITIKELKDAGIIQSKQVLNPSTKQEIKGCVIVKYLNNKYEYQYKEFNDCNKQITVTFDPNGGLVDPLTKTVTSGQPYEALPTPTKEGYEFLGWTGKNNLNLTGWLNAATAMTRGTMTKGDDWIQITATDNDSYTNTYGTSTGKYRIPVSPNTKYTISWEADSNKSGRVMVFANGLTSTGNVFEANNSTTKQLTFTTPNDATYINIRLGVAKNGDSIRYRKIQIERGDTATEFQSYYITSSTKVVDLYDHILKAEYRISGS